MDVKELIKLAKGASDRNKRIEAISALRQLPATDEINDAMVYIAINNGDEQAARDAVTVLKGRLADAKVRVGLENIARNSDWQSVCYYAEDSIAEYDAAQTEQNEVVETPAQVEEVQVAQPVQSVEAPKTVYPGRTWEELKAERKAYDDKLNAMPRNWNAFQKPASTFTLPPPNENKRKEEVAGQARERLQMIIDAVRNEYPVDLAAVLHAPFFAFQEQTAKLLNIMKRGKVPQHHDLYDQVAIPALEALLPEFSAENARLHA